MQLNTREGRLDWSSDTPGNQIVFMIRELDIFLRPADPIYFFYVVVLQKRNANEWFEKKNIVYVNVFFKQNPFYYQNFKNVMLLKCCLLKLYSPIAFSHLVTLTTRRLIRTSAPHMNENILLLRYC